MADSWAEYQAKLASVTGEHLAAAREIGSDRRRAQFLRSLEFGAWLDAVKKVMRRQYPDAYQGKEQPGEPTIPILDYVLDDGYEGALFGFPNVDETDLRTILRAMLATVDSESEVVLYYTDLLGWYSPEDHPRDLALRELREPYLASEPLIVLTEGSTDAGVLRKTLEVRYPHLKDYVSFPDFHGLNVEGGTGRLVNLVKGFAGSGVPNRVVALFDNDAAGIEAMKILDRTTLPANVRVLLLSPLEYARNYPTIGPQGTAERSTSMGAPAA